MPAHKEESDLASRKANSAAILAKHPTRIPVIVEKREGDKSLSDIDKKKFLVPNDLTIGQFVYVIRKRINLAPEQAIFLFVNSGVLPPSVAALQQVALSGPAALPSSVRFLCAHRWPRPLPQVYDQYKDEDGFLYMLYSGENTFGC